MKLLLGMVAMMSWMGTLALGETVNNTPKPLPFHAYAPTPPMGWNSWDCWGTGVTEAQTKANADFMAEKLKGHGWNLITVDIQWYEPKASTLEYRKDAHVILDGNGRLLPAENRFPSSANGKGFKPLADYVHGKGLTFGIHLLRGIPRQAVKEKQPILGTKYTAADIANVNDICPWNPDMYGVDMSKPGAQEYYDSVFKLIASWDVDFVKVDDLSRPYFDHVKEIEAIRKAIDNSGRPMVLSTSPGETPVAAAEHVKTHANLWRISDDFWDDWKALKEQFARCANWAPHIGAGHWPDADMIPFARVRAWLPKDKKGWTHFSPDEHYTLMNLWSIARSPLIFGGDLPQTDDWTLSMLTNDEVLAVNQKSSGNRQVFRQDDRVVWAANADDGSVYVALFNVNNAGDAVDVGIDFNTLGLKGPFTVRDLWQRKDVGQQAVRISATLKPHASALYKLTAVDGSKQTLAEVIKQAPIAISVANAPKAISTDLFGIFFEDLNHAADGGLYAELVENRSFEYQSTEQPTWNNLTSWETVARNGGRGHVGVGDALPVHPNNPHYVILEVGEVGGGFGVANNGYGGIAVKQGAIYDVSLFARQLFMNARWGADNTIAGRPMPLAARLETADGKVLAEAKLNITGDAWQRYAAELKPVETAENAKLVLLVGARGGITIDDVSLFPRDTFKGRPNGLRKDLAETIAALKPRFVRFPGGCLVHGWSLANIYNWKNTIGPIEQRKQMANLWGYHQSMGLGYFEYFQFCEDIGAKPLPVVAAGVTCQNAGHVAGIGQRAIPMEDMPAYVQDVLDLIEYANGPADSKWGSKRAAAGHPEPFKLEYLGVGNEEHITPAFRERFKMIYDAIKAKHPEITVIGTSGPNHSGPDYEQGWAFARELNVPIVDEHYYVSPDWFWDNLGFYDKYDRTKGQVYLGEYAAHDVKRRSTVRAALAEAAYLTSLERNGDVVKFSSYAPLLCKRQNVNWAPDMIFFDNKNVFPTASYEVQKLFGNNAGDQMLPVNLPPSKETTASCVRDSKTGEVILKIVTRSDVSQQVALDLSAVLKQPGNATVFTFSGDPDVEKATLATDTMPLDGKVELTLPRHSLTILRVK